MYWGIIRKVCCMIVAVFSKRWVITTQPGSILLVVQSRFPMSLMDAPWVLFQVSGNPVFFHHNMPLFLACWFELHCFSIFVCRLSYECSSPYFGIFFWYSKCIDFCFILGGWWRYHLIIIVVQNYVSFHFISSFHQLFMNLILYISACHSENS